jgi:apolipoprotein N-acyltransferase
MADSNTEDPAGTPTGDRSESVRAAGRTRLARAAPGLVAAALSGLLLFASFPPMDLGLVGFVAFVPLLVALGHARSYLWAGLYGAVAALFAYLPAFAWVASVAVPGWVGLALYVGFYLVVAALAIRFAQRRLGPWWPLMAAATWTALELVRARLGPGFPWLFLGYTQYRFAALRQMAAFGGVYAVSFIVFLIGAALAAMILRVPGGPSGWPSRRQLAVLAASLLVLLGATIAGRGAMARVAVTDGPVVGVVQQNIPRLVPEIFQQPQNEREEADQIARVYREMADEVRRAAELSAALRGTDVRLVVWPETTVQLPMNVSPDLFVHPRDREVLQGTLDRLKALGADMDTHFLVGAPTYYPRDAGYVEDARYDTESRDYGNSAVLMSPEGRFLERYDKIRLVPFGEYIPLRETFPFLERLTPIGREITPGAARVIFGLPRRTDGEEVRFCALICYEDVFADLTRAFRRDGAQFMVNLTDEGWYYIRGELEQHLAMAVFRAVETRTTVVRAANTGISCFIDPRGDVYAALPPLTEGALSAPVRLCDRITPYVRHGDCLAWCCLAAAIALPLILIIRRRTVNSE